MDEIKEIEESANSFLKNFFDTTYNDNKVLKSINNGTVKPTVSINRLTS